MEQTPSITSWSCSTETGHQRKKKIKMYSFLAVLCLIAGGYARVLDEQYCHNQETYFTIYQVPNHGCKCTAKVAGALRYKDGNLQVCNGNEYVNVGGNAGREAPVGTETNPGKSCRDILTKRKDAKSGMYFIKPRDVVMKTYCYMGTLCGSNGWTMVMKIDGKKNTFRYDSKYWSNKQHYNVAGATGGFNHVETKLDTYSHFPLSKLCLGLETKGKREWKEINYMAGSLYELIADGKFRETHYGRTFWKSMVPDSSLQRNCGLEGFNVVKLTGSDKRNGFAKVRIGIIGNQENDCHSPDSRIGFGAMGNLCGQNNDNSAGNEARCSPDNGDKTIKSFGYIFAQERQEDALLGSFDNPAKSCKEIVAARPDAKNGVYYLNLRDAPHTRVYCHMTEICGSRGWTIIMKIDGRKTTFKYESSYWKNHNVYNTESIADGLDNSDMKLHTYSKLPFEKLCLGMRVGGSLEWLPVNMGKKVDSLFSVIAPGKYVATHISKNEWRKLVPGSSLQRNCNRQGFNNAPAGGNHSKVRIGFVANQENNCGSTDSRIGFGASGTACGQSSSSAGNEARCDGDKGNKSVAGYGYILAQ
ncbi:uncharacterized protein LOC116609941 isoform X1 [Nematostella vectensis]|uniref:uncharacterized protein LOC116609941 isoform X1 n=1 Tax=Nematostella vectensis TaxID=45351 RepID=UPI00207743F5|nr:uncharacterized protein LOC116609941 isoform X1 [Nematostella vectensis]